MLMASVYALASLSPTLEHSGAALLPDLADVRHVSVNIAAAVVRRAVSDGLAQDERAIKLVEEGGDRLERYIRSRMWDPVYRPLELVD